MSNCSTATSARRRRRHDDDFRGLRRRLFCQLEARLCDIERHWDDGYRASRSGAPRRHRRSRSPTAGAPSSAITTAAGPDEHELLSDVPLRCSPRRVIFSLQHIGSDDGDNAGAVSVEREDCGGQLRGNEEADDASSVGSVGVAKHPVPSASSCSCCHHHCATAPRRRSYSTDSSCDVSTQCPFSPARGAGGGVVERARKTEEGRCVTGNDNRVKWFAAIFLVVMGFIVVALVGMDEEFLVPT